MYIKSERARKPNYKNIICGLLYIKLYTKTQISTHILTIYFMQ